MAQVTGFTAARMQEIIDDNIVDAELDANSNLILVTRGGQQINLGSVRGGQGVPGPAGSITKINGKTGGEITLTVDDLGIDLSGLMPIGTIVATARSTAPSGYVLCQGQSLARTGTYAALFAAIGSAYTPTASTTNFNVPDLRARVPVGRHTSYTQFDTLGETGGEMAHTLTQSEIPAHAHYTALERNSDSTSGTFGLQAGSTFFAGRVMVAAADDGRATKNQGGGASHNILQPYQVVNYMIKY